MFQIAQISCLLEKAQNMNSETEKLKVLLLCYKAGISQEGQRPFKTKNLKHLRHWSLSSPCIRGKNPETHVSYKPVSQKQLISLFFTTITSHHWNTGTRNFTG